MPTQEQWRQAQDFERVLQAAQRKRLLWVHRPIYLHERAPDSNKCECGCDSRHARHTSTRDHIDVLIDRIDGTRRVRSQVEDKAEFDRLCEHAERIDLPLRCYAKQLQAILAKPRVTIATGGVRGGKTSICGEACLDECLEHGGPGAQIWWVAPTLEKTRIGVRKLVLGEVIGKGKQRRVVRPLFPPELVRSYPHNTRSADQTIRLIDGTQIHLKYAESDSLKGDPPQFIEGDEFCAVRDSRAGSTYQQMLDRTAEGGRVMLSTTPTAGHYLEEVSAEAIDLDKWDGSNPRRTTARITFTMRDNPWVAESDFEATVLAKSGAKTLEEGLKHPTVRREVLGEFVADGERLWSHFDARIHLFEGASRTAAGYGLENITNRAARDFFYGHEAKIDKAGGQDFNLFPMSLVICEIACHPALDSTNPQNWTLIAHDEVLKNGTVFTFAEHLKKKAACIRALPEDYYHGLPIACDPSGAQPQNKAIQAAHSLKSSTLAAELNAQGFDCRPCHRDPNGNPRNPPMLDRISLMHKLMRDRIALPDGVLWQGRFSEIPRLLVHGTRCKKLLYAIETQQADDRGRFKKRSWTVSDRVAGPMDAFSYFAWAIFGLEEYNDPPDIQWD